MITITLEVDEVTDVAYQNLSEDHKKQLNEDIYMAIRQAIYKVRSQRIRKICEELAKDESCKDLSAEVLSELLRDED